MQRVVNGFQWPEYDIVSSISVWGTLDALDAAVALCPQRRVAVHVGAGVGVWTKRLADAFGVVYAFEPDHDNFSHLCRNCDAPNVIRLQAALGGIAGHTALMGDRRDCGQIWLERKGNVPVLTLDSFKLEALDFLAITTEGFETYVLKGAGDTLAKHRPVVLAESSGKGWKYGFEEDDLDRAVTDYKVENRPPYKVLTP